MERSKSTLVLVGLFALLVGCAQNAVFELHVRLPSAAASPAGARFARIRTGSERLDFDQTWLTSATPAIPLLATESQTVMLSIVGSGAQLTEDLRVKVELYATEDGEPVEERRYAFEHPFYQGFYTCSEQPSDTHFADPALDETDPMTGMVRVDLPVVEIDRCHIIGCTGGNSVETPVCGSDGRHSCELPYAPRSAGPCDDILARDRNVGM